MLAFFKSIYRAIPVRALRQFEPATTAAFTRFVKTGWTILDIGANVGAHALPLAKLVGPTGRVFAFEPTSFAYRKLSRNISLNRLNNISAWRLALSNYSSDQQEIKFQATWPTIGRPVIQPCRTDFRRLDDWCKEQGVTEVHLIKIDVDGHEFPVLDGARELLARCHPILLIEVGAWHFGEPKTNPLRLLRDLGYHFYDERTRAEFPGLEELRNKIGSTGQGGSINLIAQAPIGAVAGDAVCSGSL